MPNILDHVAYLSQTIGPRPAGTEEEQQAALYITEQLQQEAGLPAVIEDFNGSAGYDSARAVCSALTVVITVLSLFLSFMIIPALVVTVVSALLFVAEALGKPVLSKLFKRGVSQNVVAKYEPRYSEELGGTRRRKIVVVAHYDSGKVAPQYNGALLGLQGQLAWVALGGMVATPVLLMIKNFFFLNATGAPAVVFTVLTVLALICAALPLVGGIVHKFSAYNEAANCNASGVAVLMDVAARVNKGASYGASAYAYERPLVHGEEAARASGFAPEGARLSYEVSTSDVAGDDSSPAARLAAAKAAVAALTGRPVSTTVTVPAPDSLGADDSQPRSAGSSDESFGQWDGSMPEIAADFAQDAAEEDAPAPSQEGADEAADFQAASPDQTADGFSDVPDWFRKAQQKAKKSAAGAVVQRSRYADALDAAVAEPLASSASFESEPDTEQRLQRMRESIMAVTPPTVNRERFLQVPAVDVPAPAIVSEAAVQPAVAALDGATIAMPMPAPSGDSTPHTGRRSMQLPSLDASAQISGDVRADGSAAAQPQASPVKNILAALPSIDAPATQTSARPAVPALSLPSLSGIVSGQGVSSQTAQQDDVTSSGMPRAAAPAFGGEAPSGATVAFDPVSAQLREENDPQNLYVADADDSDYEGSYAEGSVFPGGDYVEMPKSRLQKLFGRFKKKKEPEISTQEWLDVDESFDARTVGAARGGWESFRTDGFDNDGYDDGFDDGFDDEPVRNRRWNGGMYSAGESGAFNLDEIFQFHDTVINTEVWFVALGSDLAGNNGMQAFLQEHAQELRGSILVELEALGAGDLCLVDREGSYLPAQTSSRMKRYVKKAAGEVGVSVGAASMPWKNSASAYAIKQGYQAMHLVGMACGKPAFYGQKDDVIENVDEQVLAANSDFVMELIKNI